MGIIHWLKAKYYAKKGILYVGDMSDEKRERFIKAIKDAKGYESVLIDKSIDYKPKSLKLINSKGGLDLELYDGTYILHGEITITDGQISTICNGKWGKIR